MEKNYIKAQYFQQSIQDYGGKEYYFNNSLEQIKVGDKVVVETAGHYQVVLVTEILSSVQNEVTKNVIAILDIEKANERNQKIADRKRIKAQIVQRAREVAEMSKLKELAKEDETLSELLDIYKGL